MSDVRDTQPVLPSAVDDPACGDARATLEAWREAGADRLDPLRFAAIDALARRITTLQSDGELRRLLDARLAASISAYHGEIERKRNADAIEAPAPQPGDAQRDTSLAALAASLKQRPDRAQTLADLLQYFDAVWSKLSAGRQLRQSLAQVPGNAGPLNSSRLVHRALSLMNDLSPEYLQHFLSYVETLSALGEPGGGAQAPGVESVPRGKNVKGAKQAVRRKPKAG
ncbi:DUF2894 domain-containing protein [Paraburkholderia solisilvae]|uniref:DUF2894 domain-containing protein n=1 Tax=Paraburkholderia solisilvae TaxID=624376 RepID=A0A6J5E5D5_9BURK|nr:DUF2894 domain-containing protein [Paraburkholderia solisilvae]CAB3760516.1 hypothetical protein LMG29739_03414 [Paraburkholderia solisilvae]